MLRLIERAPARVLAAARGHRQSLKNPAKSVEEYLAALEKLGLTGTVPALRPFTALLPPIRPITTGIELFRATCPCCKARVTASAPADMPEGTPFGPGIASIVTYLHGCQMVGYKRLTEVCQGVFGLTISQGAIANVLARVGEAIAAPAERSRQRCVRAR